MHPNLYLLWIFAATTQHAACFYTPCGSPQSEIMSDDECMDLYFEPSEKETKLGRVALTLKGFTLNITPQEKSWSDAFVRVSEYGDRSKRFCSKLPKKGVENFCVGFTPEMINHTFLVEYKAERAPEANSRKFLFELPPSRVGLFPYIDFTDTSRLIFKAHKIDNNNFTSFKVEAFKVKNNKTNLQDMRFFSSEKEFFYELYTYNDEGSYYFVVTAQCGDFQCLQITTPKYYIGRKSTRLVIGIVGASFILPFVLFVFHILTKKFPEESQDGGAAIAVVYRSSTSTKHNEIVAALASLLQKFSRKQVNVEVVDLSKSVKKTCVDSLLFSGRVVYVAPPRDDFVFDKSMSDKEVRVVVFDHCKLPPGFEDRRVFRMFDDFDRFLSEFDVAEPHGGLLYKELVRKAEEAKLETEVVEVVPKIVVTKEPQEHDSLL